MQCVEPIAFLFVRKSLSDLWDIVAVSIKGGQLVLADNV